MNKNLKIVLITLTVIGVVLLLVYFIMKKTFGIKNNNTESTSNTTTAILTKPILPNSPEDLALRTYRAATGQNSI